MLPKDSQLYLVSNMLKTLEDMYVDLHNMEAQVYQMYKDSDESSSVHLTSLQMDLNSAISVLEDLLGKE